MKNKLDIFRIDKNTGEDFYRIFINNEPIGYFIRKGNGNWKFIAGEYNYTISSKQLIKIKELLRKIPPTRYNISKRKNNKKERAIIIIEADNIDLIRIFADKVDEMKDKDIDFKNTIKLSYLEEKE